MTGIVGGWTRTLALWQRAANVRALQDLPTIQIGPLMTDDDVNFHSDMIELRCGLDDLLNAAIETGEKLRGYVNLVDAHRFGLDWWEQGWPVDEAALMLANWQAQREAVAAA